MGAQPPVATTCAHRKARKPTSQMWRRCAILLRRLQRAVWHEGDAKTPLRSRKLQSPPTRQFSTQIAERPINSFCAARRPQPFRTCAVSAGQHEATGGCEKSEMPKKGEK